MSKVIVYDPSSIDSSIAAAIILTNFQNDAVSVTSGNLSDLYDEYYWVGVETSKFLLDKIPQTALHRGIYINHQHPLIEKRFKYLSTWDDVAAYLEPIWDGVDEFIPVTLTAIAAAMYSKEPSMDSYWPIIQLIDDFDRGRKMSLEDQALLWRNMEAASITLTGSKYRRSSLGLREYTPYHPAVKNLGGSELMISNYLSFLKGIKAEISESVELFTVKFDNEKKVMPVVNMLPDHAPWAVRIMSATYPFGLIYDHKNGKAMYSTYSRIPGLHDAIIETVLARHDKRFGRGAKFYSML